VAAPIVFRSTDSGAPALSGTVSALLGVLNACLICRMVFTSTNLAGSTDIVDNTNKARSQSTAANAGTWLPFQTGTPGAATDACFLGLTSKFGRAKLSLSTLGTSVVGFTVEYWNGSAWTAVTGLTDGTSGLTASGTISWTIASGWATAALNGVTCYWIRLRYTSYAVMPIVQYCTLTGWTQVYGPTTNQCDFQHSGGTAVFYDVNDNGPGAGAAKEARFWGYETVSALATGTGQFPGSALSFIRKSVTADATARAWLVIADDRTCIMFLSTGDAAGRYYMTVFGEFYSNLPNDPYRNIVMGSDTENTASPTSTPLSCQNASMTTVTAGQYLDRAWTGIGAAKTMSIHIDNAKNHGSVNVGGGANMAFPNGPDGGVELGPIWIVEPNLAATFGHIRGRLRGLMTCFQAAANFTDGDPIAGAGAYVGKTFLVVKTVTGGSAVACYIVVETSDTWETN
jgi:hypothetical protein